MKRISLILIATIFLVGCNGNKSSERITYLEDKVIILEKELYEIKEQVTDMNESIIKDTSHEYINDIIELDNKMSSLEKELESIDYNSNEIKEIKSKLSQLEVTYKSNLFDETKISVDDTVCGFEVVSIERPGEPPIGSIIEFEGYTEVTGSFSHNDESEFFDKMILFIPDEESILKIPKSFTDTRNIAFELTSYDNISEKFGQVGSKGIATVLINGYYLITIPRNVVNAAKLINIENIVFDNE